jgi:hypothetical protein
VLRRIELFARSNALGVQAVSLIVQQSATESLHRLKDSPLCIVQNRGMSQNHSSVIQLIANTSQILVLVVINFQLDCQIKKA